MKIEILTLCYTIQEMKIEIHTLFCRMPSLPPKKKKEKSKGIEIPTLCCTIQEMKIEIPTLCCTIHKMKIEIHTTC